MRGLIKGALSGAAGTLAMDLVWYRRYRKGGGGDGFAAWELSRSTKSFEEAGAPAQVGKRLAALAHVDLPDEAAAATNNVVHWATGVQWGAAYGLLAARRGKADPVSGMVLGLVACSTSYVVLPALGIYKPIWEYDRATLLQDYSAHLAFGAVTGVATCMLMRCRQA